MKTILIVDDDAKYRSMMRLKLEASGFHVMEADDGEKALDTVHQHAASIDLILLDLVMSGMDGLTFYYHFKKSLNSDKPVIVLTNLSTTAYPSDIKDIYIKTDITLDALVKKIQDRIS